MEKEDCIMATVSEPLEERCRAPAEQRFLLGGIEWSTYRAISDALTGRHLRITYDRGNLDLMTISGAHGHLGRLTGRFIFVLAEELGLPIRSFGDATCDREDLERGVEPDESFYLTNEPLIREKEEIDLQFDPPPDLVVEVEISRSSRRRQGIYAAMKVPEIWLVNGDSVRFLQLGPDGQYALSDRSRYFPSLPLHHMADFLRQRTQMDEVRLVRTFRAWVRDQLAKSPPSDSV
jgi:Uma2 family endonuclease